MYVSKCTSVTKSYLIKFFIGFYLTVNIKLNQIHNLKSTLEMTVFSEAGNQIRKMNKHEKRRQIN